MADLSSCYFCSAAMDVSLREYAVVPEAFEPTPRDQATVLVCGSCQRKLDRALEPVVNAAREQAARARRDHATANRSHQGQNATRRDHQSRSQTQTDADANQSGTDTATPIVPPSANGDPDTRNAQHGTADPTADATATDASDTATSFDVDETASVFDDTDDGDDVTDSVFSEGTTTIDSQDSGGTDAADTTLGDGIDFITDDDPSGSSTTDTGSSDGRPPDATSTTTGTGESTSADTTPDVDPNTYNKVVRLLQNRDLPTPRSEIETIASSAYDIPTLETEAIIDTAIQRGLIAERGDELVHPDDT